MGDRTPTPKFFDHSKFNHIIENITDAMSDTELEAACEEIIFDILKNYENYEIIKKVPDYWGRPFGFLGFKTGSPFIIEFKGALDTFIFPGESQKLRLKDILSRVDGLNIALLQIKLNTGQYRLFYDKDLETLFRCRRAPVEPLVDWIQKKIHEQS